MPILGGLGGSGAHYMGLKGFKVCVRPHHRRHGGDLRISVCVKQVVMNAEARGVIVQVGRAHDDVDGRGGAGRGGK